MAASIKIDVWQVSGPFGDVVIEPLEEGYVVGIIPFHRLKRCSRTTQTPKPQVLPGVWQLPPKTKNATGGVKFIACKIEMLTKYLERIDLAEWRCGLEAVVEKPGSGFFKVEAIAVVRNRNITGAQKLVQFLAQHPVIFRIGLIPWEIGKGMHRDPAVSLPLVGKGQ